MLPLLASSFRVSIETLRASPLRTLLSTLGIIIGVASLVAVLSLGDGMQGFVRSQIGETTDLQLMSVAARTNREVDGVTLPRTDTVRFTRQLITTLQSSAGAPVVAGLTEPGVAVADAGGKQRAVRILGTDAAVLALQNVTIGAGRAFSDSPADSDAVLLTKKAARELAGANDRELGPGDSVVLGRTTLHVAGILAGNQTDREASAVVRAEMVPRIAAGRGGFPSVLIRANRFDDVATVRKAVDTWLATSLGPAWKERATVSNRADRVAQVQQAMLLFKLFMGAITGISLIVGGIGVMNVLLAAVAERTREIGVRRAVGAAKRHIVAQFLAESVTISAVGSVGGIILGLAGSYGITAAMRTWSKAKIYAGLSASTLLVAVAATVVVGLSFGVYPALTASRLSPIDAIRHE